MTPVVKLNDCDLYHSPPQIIHCNTIHMMALLNFCDQETVSECDSPDSVVSAYQVVVFSLYY